MSREMTLTTITLVALCGCQDLTAPQEPRQIDGNTQRIGIHQPRDVDLLIVADNSHDMAEEIDTLQNQLPLLLEELLRPTVTPEGDHLRAFESVRVGVVTTDMGVVGHDIQTCEGSDEGALRFLGEEYCDLDPEFQSQPWVDATADTLDESAFRGALGCQLDFRDVGCGVEQPFEASLAALTTQAGEDGRNTGFLREDSLLIVLYVTSEDDCSIADPDLFDPSIAELGSPNTRCVTHPEMLHTVDRYIEGLRALRPGREDLVIVSAIAGVPIDGSWEVGQSLDDLAELQRLNPENENQILGSCDTAMGGADAPVRLAELVYDFGDAGLLASICRADWTDTFLSLAQTAQRRADTCLTGVPEGGLFEHCRLVETLPDDRPCRHLSSGWKTDLGLDAQGRRQCEVVHYNESSDGWYHTYAGTSCQWGVLDATRPDILDEDAELTLYCES